MKIEKFTRVKGYKYRVLDAYKTPHLFKTYRDALYFILQ